MPGMTLKIAKGSPKHKKFLEELTSRVKMAEQAQSDQHGKWDLAERTINAYVPESEDDAKRRHARDVKGEPHFTTIKIPYTYALLMAAHTYWTSVFFARSPIHQFSGVHGEGENSVQALEAIIDYQVRVGKLLAPYYLWLYDAGKYGHGVLGTYWDKEQHSYSVLSPKGDTYITRTVNGYEGNKAYNVSPWDFLHDPRVPLGRFQEGEFCAIYREMSWNDLKLREAQNYYMNTGEIKSSTPRTFERSGEGWMRRPSKISDIGSNESKHPAWVGIYEVYVTLIPEEWELGNMAMPEKWVFTMTADKALIIGAQPLGAIHNKYPFDVMEPEPEAYALYNRGIPEVVEGLQNTMDWLFNSHFHNVRAIANGRYVADPSRLDLSQLESGEPGWIATLRPEAWGQNVDIRSVFQQIQTTDPTANHLNDSERLFQLGERTTGINEQILGALSGGRKTATEIRTSTGFGVNRLKTASEFMSATGFSDHSMKLVQNTQQYMAEPIKLTLMGDMVKFGGAGLLNVDPQMIAGQYQFVMVDGTLPVDRFAQATLWKDLLGQMSQVPAIMAEFDLAKIFAWVAGLGGLKNIDQMRIGSVPPNIEVVEDDVLGQEAAAGNLIPFQAPGGGANGMLGGPGQ